MSAYQSIPEYYAGKSLFITGGTGFLGKALVEKLLRSCPDIKKIYLLVRPKGDVGSKERVEKILDSEVGFHRKPIQHYSCQMNFKNMHVQKSTNYLSLLIHKLHGGMFVTYTWSRLCETALSIEWTIPKLDKLLNSRTILAQLEELPKFSKILKFGCKIL